MFILFINLDLSSYNAEITCDDVYLKYAIWDLCADIVNFGELSFSAYFIMKTKFCKLFKKKRLIIYWARYICGINIGIWYEIVIRVFINCLISQIYSIHTHKHTHAHTYTHTNTHTHTSTHSHIDLWCIVETLEVGRSSSNAKILKWKTGNLTIFSFIFTFIILTCLFFTLFNHSAASFKSSSVWIDKLKG